MPDEKSKPITVREGINFREDMKIIDDGIDSLEEIRSTIEATLPSDLLDSMELSTLTGTIFKFSLSTKVRNMHNETGYVSLCGIDFRGEIFLVNYKNCKSVWHVPEELTEVPMSYQNDNNNEDENDNNNEDEITSNIKTDIITDEEQTS